MAFDPEFKNALRFLADKEKDKLILRLLKYDVQLANRLRFELVDTDSVQERREQVGVQIVKRIQSATAHYYSSRYLLLEIRVISGAINRHVFVTRDKMGEVTLNCLMIRELLELNNDRLSLEIQSKSYTLFIYLVARVFKILILLQKQHEDLHLEFREDIETIGALICNNPSLKEIAICNGLDVNWLIQFRIPENISKIYSDLRAKGLLR